MMSKGSLRKYLHTVGDQEGRAKSLASLDKVINRFKIRPKDGPLGFGELRSGRRSEPVERIY